MRVRHAKLLNVIGRPSKFGGFTLVPADLELKGQAFRPSYRLNELPPERLPPVLRLPVEHQYDVAWVRARLPHEFGIEPEPAELEKALLAVHFIAVRQGGEEGIPFLLSDYYGKTSLTFSEAESDEQLKHQIADAFWGTLLAEPDELADFTARVFHVGAGVWLDYGCNCGEPYCFESHDDSPE